MEKKKYQQPQAQSVAIGTAIMQDTVSVNTGVWGNQTDAESRRYRNSLWDDEEDDL